MASEGASYVERKLAVAQIEKGTYIVDDNVHSLDIDTSTKDVSSNEDSLLKSLELLESRDSIESLS